MELSQPSRSNCDRYTRLYTFSVLITLAVAIKIPNRCVASPSAICLAADRGGVLWQIEKAGGHSSGDGQLKSCLDIPIENHDQRAEVCYGSLEEVKRFEETVYDKSPRFSGQAAAK